MAIIDRYGTFDVVIAGGGLAGVSAAIASARSGAETLLIEKAGWLGGLGATGATGLHSFYNIFSAHPGAEPLCVAGGIAQEIFERVQILGGGVGHVRMERGGDFVSMLSPVEPEILKLACSQLCDEAHVHLLLHTTIIDAQAYQGKLRSINIWNKSGKSRIIGRQFVDCTGDGDLAAYAGAPFINFKANDKGAYSAGFTFRLVNIDLQALQANLEDRGLITQLAHAIKPGMEKPDLVRLGIAMHKVEHLEMEIAPNYFLASSLRPRELTYVNCINFGPNDGLDTLALTSAELYLRRRMLEISELFRHNFAGCGECYPAGPAPSAGQRRSRAIRCEYELTRDDLIQAIQFSDQIGCFAFIDNPHDFVRDGLAYGIPFRALIPLGVENLLVAGRMLSVDISAHNSTRNTVCCMICGQAAGTAAALSVKRNRQPRTLDTAELQETLYKASVLLTPQPGVLIQ
jgi:hypothetical protein